MGPEEHEENLRRVDRTLWDARCAAPAGVLIVLPLVVLGVC